MMADCKFRNGFWCNKLNKAVPIDARDSEDPKCWLQPKSIWIDGCRGFEKKD